MPPTCWALIGCVFAAAAPARADDTASPASKVIAVRRGLMLVHTGADGQTHEDGAFDVPIADVRAQRGEWVGVRQAGVSGWLPRRDVVPLEQACAYFTDRIRKNPGDDFAYFARGVYYSETGDAETAFRDFDQAVRLDPNRPEVFFVRGLARMRGRECDQAVADLSEGLRQRPEAASAYLWRGYARMAKSDYDRAVTDFDAILRLEPGNVAALGARAGDRMSQGKWDGAVADLDAAIRLDPKNANLRMQRAVCREAMTDHAQALADFDEAARLHPQDRAPLNDRAWLRATCPDKRCRDGVRALSDAKAICQDKDAQNSDYLTTLAAAYAETGDFDEAVRRQTQVVSLLTDAKEPVEDAQERLALYKSRKPYRGE